MYPVSEAFLQAVQGNTRRFFWIGRITTKAGAAHEFGNGDYALETDDGLTMNLGVNPLLQFGLEETRKALLENILYDLSIIRYVPFDSGTIGNPALDLGDVLVFSGGHADETQLACVTGYQIKVNGKHSLKCVGKNPRLAQAKSKNDKKLSGLLNQIEAGKIGIHTFTNASAYTVNETDVKIGPMSILWTKKVERLCHFFSSSSSFC